MNYDIAEIRTHFSSLQSGAIFFDNPGGTQVCREVIDAVVNYYQTANANTHGAFATSQRSDALIAQARDAFADFLNARSPNEIVFGPNMTTLTFNISRALGRHLSAGDEIIVTHLDHDADIAPWLALEERGVLIKWVDVHPDDCTLDMAEFEKHLGAKTKIVAVGGASNAVGTMNDLKTMIELAHIAGAIVFVDAVHLAPHAPIDVQDLDCDLLACSAYKFYGPHLGVLYGKYDLLEQLRAYKVRPADNQPPYKFETGTQNHEGIAGALAAVNYLASVGEKYGAPFAAQFKSFSGRRLSLKVALAAIKQYEKELFIRLMRGLREISGITIYGIADFARIDYRTPTVAFTLDGKTPRAVAEYLGCENIYVWDGNYYALALMERLGLEEHGGAVRVGLAHYNTSAEVEGFLQAMKQIVQGQSSVGHPIVIVPYDPLWRQLFAQLGADLRRVLGKTALRIDHIGSTAIEGMDAKPIIDIQVSVASFESLDAYRTPLASLGYVFRADNPELTKRYFRETPGNRRTHIHIRRAGSWSEQFALLFRDYLRTHNEDAKCHAELKYRLAEEYREDRGDYVDAKSPFIWKIMQKADKWSQDTGWEPGLTDA